MTGALVSDYRAASNGGSDRGFTGHEHFDDLELVHMNGRLYEPRAGGFLQADPFVPDALDLQATDRYAYVRNNPLAAIDPSGYFSLSDPFNVARHFLRHPYAARRLGEPRRTRASDNARQRRATTRLGPASSARNPVTEAHA